MDLLALSINQNTLWEREKLNSSFNLDKSFLIINLIIFVGMLFGSIVIRGIRDSNIFHLYFVSKIEEKRIYNAEFTSFTKKV